MIVLDASAYCEALLRQSGDMTGYDAAYVALAARLELPLMTGDQRLAQAPGLPCAVEAF